MGSPQHHFEIATADILQVSDREIRELLQEVYVAGGFTTQDEAATLFAPAAVRARGQLIAARDAHNRRLAGMVIVVPPDSPARRLAQDNEAELHLLGVMPGYRRHGLGRMLVDAALDRARGRGCSRMILWTQRSMLAAQRLYAAAGFLHIGEMERNGRGFMVYARDIA